MDPVAPRSLLGAAVVGLGGAAAIARKRNQAHAPLEGQGAGSSPQATGEHDN